MEIEFDELAKRIKKEFPHNKYYSKEWVDNCLQDRDLGALISYLEEILLEVKDEVIESLLKECVIYRNAYGG